MRIGDRDISAGSRPYIIAEIGVNHDGSAGRAIELVEAAAQAGADAIKLQYFEAERLLSRAARLAAYQKQAGVTDPLNMLKQLELSVDELQQISEAAGSHNLHRIVTVFSVELIEQVGRIAWDAYKTASPDIINRPLIDSLRATGQPLLLSTGAATLDEIKEATKWLGDTPHVLMHCVSSYPVPDEYANLAGRQAMLAVNVNALGYSDHTTAVDTAALAVASGCVVLEKHLTWNRDAPGPDHAASLDPQQFAEYVRLAHRACRMQGKNSKTVQTIEDDVRLVARQSVTTARDLKSGQVIARDDLTIKRPGTGLPPVWLEQLVGCTVKRDVEADMPLMREDVDL